MTAVSVTLPQFTTDPAAAVESAVAADELGFDTVFLVDHLIPLGEPHRPVLELAATLGAVAAATRRIRVGTLVLRASLRGPAISTAIAGTAAALAPGRLVVGLGAGDSATAEEQRRFGLPGADLDRRIGQVAETVAGIRAVAPGASVWIGGSHRRIRELAAATADGWNRWAGSEGDLRAEAASLGPVGPGFTVSWGTTVVLGATGGEVEATLAARSAGGDVLAGTPGVVAAGLERMVRAGAGHLTLSLLPRSVETLELFATAVRPRLAA